MLEDGVQAAWRRINGRKDRRADAEVTLWEKAIGFAWVCSFFAIFAPMYHYRSARFPIEEGYMVKVMKVALLQKIWL